MVKGLFGGKGKGDFYLQLDETKESKQAETPAATGEPVAQTEAPAQETPATETEVAPAPAATTTKSKSVKSKTKSASAPAPVATAAPAPKALDSEELAKQAIAKTTSKKAASQDSPTGFASDSLLPLPTARRMPGPSLNAFKEMARQAKVPNK